MLNGSTLKIGFLMIMFTLCAIILIVMVGVVWFKFPLEDSKMIVGMLGISSLFGGITQAFIHANIQEASKVAPDSSSVTTKTTVVPATAQEVKP